MLFIRKFKRLLPILCLASALVLVGCDLEPAASSESVVAQDAEAAELTNQVEISEAGFSVVPPVRYSVDLDILFGVQLLANGATVDSGPMITILGSGFGEALTADQMYEFMVATDETLSEVKRLPNENLIDDGFVAEFRRTEGEETIKGRMTLTIVDDQGILVTAIAPEEAWEKGFESIVAAVESSIERFPAADY